MSNIEVKLDETKEVDDTEELRGKQIRDFLVKRFETIVKFVSIHTNGVRDGEPQVTYWNNSTLQSMLG